MTQPLLLEKPHHLTRPTGQNPGARPKLPVAFHFERCLAYAQALKAEGFTATKLNDLSSQIRSVYGGMGSFADYAPMSTGPGNAFSVIAGMDNFDAASKAVYQHALDSANVKALGLA